VRPAALFVALSLAALLAAACGVAFSSPPRDNTLFQSLHVTGKMNAGAPLTAALTYQQYLPVKIDVTCELWQHSKQVKEIGKDTVPELPGGSPKQTPFPGNFSLDFTVDQPGSYAVKCYTASDKDNTILTSFTIGEAVETPTPTQ
jgi:hypothetical protein